MPLKLTTYYKGKDIPDLPGKNTFHSKELFLIYEATPGLYSFIDSGNGKRQTDGTFTRSHPQSKKMAPLFIGKTLCSIQ